MANVSELLELLSRIQGNLEIQSKSAASVVDAWKNSIAEKGFLLAWSAEDLHIYGKSEINARQEGYQSKEWKDSWVAIADAHADPFILESKTGKVLFAFHGQGSWKALEIAEDAESFMRLLKVYVETYYVDFNGEIFNDEYEVRADFIEKTKGRLSSMMSKEQAENFIFSLAA